MKMLTLILCILMSQILSCSRESPKEYGSVVIFQFQSGSRVKSTRYFELRVSPDARIFREPQEVNGFSVLPSLVECPVNVRNKVKAFPKNVIGVIDCSPDQNWATVRYIPEERKSFFYDYVALLNLNEMQIAKEIPFCSGMYVWSNVAFYDDALDLKQINLASNEISNVSKNQTFFMLPDRTGLIVFDDGKIKRFDIQQQVSQVVGRHAYYARFSGAIDSNWGYYLTEYPKEVKMQLYFLNLKTFKSVRYPYNLPNGVVVGINKDRSNLK